MENALEEVTYIASKVYYLALNLGDTMRLEEFYCDGRSLFVTILVSQIKSSLAQRRKHVLGTREVYGFVLEEHQVVLGRVILLPLCGGKATTRDIPDCAKLRPGHYCKLRFSTYGFPEAYATFVRRFQGSSLQLTATGDAG